MVSATNLALHLSSIVQLAVSSTINHAKQTSLQNKSSVGIQNDCSWLIYTTRVASVCSKFQSYTALGDSYAAGYGSVDTLPICRGDQDPGRDSCTTEACGNGTGAYSYQFAHAYGITNFQYLACNGNDSLSVLCSQVETSAFGNPDLITINVGGDDKSLCSKVVIGCMVGHGPGGKNVKLPLVMPIPPSRP